MKRTHFAVVLVQLLYSVTISKSQLIATPPPPSDVPVFQPNNYLNISVLETVPVGTVILGNLNVTSSGRTGMLINMTCVSTFDTNSGACGPFSLTASMQTNTIWYGSMTVNTALDAKLKSSYFLTLVAINGNYFANQNVSITVGVARLRPPNFIGATSASTPELSTISPNPIIQYQAVDGNGILAVRFQLCGNPGEYFRIEDVTGRLFNTKPILLNDTNWSQGYMTICVEAGEVLSSGAPVYGNSSTSTQIASTITLVETSDNPPVFELQSYVGNVDEKSPAGTFVRGIVIRVTDPDRSPANSTFQLYLDNYANVFRVDPNTGNRTVTAQIIVANSSALDYNAGPQSYSFNVIAYETMSVLHLSASAAVTVNLNPENDYPPVFTQPIYYVAISELIKPGRDVITVTATDRDIYPDFGTASIRYKFSGITPLFKIDKYNGSITVAACDTPGSGVCIDYEQTKAYQLTVLAVDNYGEGYTAVATVNVTIIDENDNPPVFQSRAYYGTIKEYQTVPSPQLVVTAVDIDSSYNGNNNVTYSIVGGNDNNLWTITPYSGVITATRPINYTDTPGHQGTFVLTVEARDPDPTHKDAATVYISVTPVNQYAPVFTSNSFTATILETTPPGTSILRVTATDQDSPYTPDGQVQYLLLAGGQDKFTINSTTGDVFVAPGATFDAIAQNNYTISVLASDGGNPQKTATGILIINVLPNRPTPTFVPSVIRPPPIVQNATNGTVVVTLFANNTNPYKQLVYSFVDNQITGLDPRNQPVNLNSTDKMMFVVDPVTGIVTVNQPLSYDRIATWQVIVRAVDTNATGQTGTATLIITILPINTKPPSFGFPWTPQNPSLNQTLVNWKTPSNYVFNIPATSPNNSLVVNYKLLNDYNGAFNISNQTGVVGLVRPLNIAMDRNVSFVVIAYDNGFPSLTSTATVNVQLVNINAYSPSFTQSDYNATIPDNIQNGTVVTTITATDPDYGDYGVVGYQFSDVPPDSRFLIDNVTGVITIAPGATFNGAIESLIILHVQAYDSPNDPLNRRYNTTTVQISVTSTNKNPPKFTQPIYPITIPEITDISNPLIQVLAIKDNSPGAKVSYSIVAGNDQGIFTINPSNGAISAVTSLIGKSGTYNLTVMATDTGNPPLSGTAFVIITVVPSSYPIPKWWIPTQDGQIVYIDEKVPFGTYVTTVNATNANNPNSPVSYYMYYQSGLGRNTTGDFAVNSVTGVITTARNFGYEGGSTFVLNVYAVDQFNTYAMRTVIVVVRWVQFENPWFAVDNNNCTLPISWTISINAPNSSVVGKLSANLTDPNAAINYQILDFDFPPGLFQLQPTSDHRSVQVIYLGNGVIKTPKMYNFTVKAVEMTFNPDDIPAKMLCHGKANQTNVLVHINVVEIKPTFDNDLHTCVRDDAEIGTNVYTFTDVNYDTSRPVYYQLATISCTNPPSGSSCGMEYYSSKIFNVTNSGNVVTMSSMSGYKEDYFTVATNATFDSLSFSDAVVTIYVVPYTREMLVTFNKPPDAVKADMPNTMQEISNFVHGGKVCIVSYQYHVSDQGVVDPGRTDVFMYVIDGFNQQVVTPLGLDSVFNLTARKKTGIIGITEAYSFWAGFLYHPVAIAIGIIIGLVVLALLLFLCCCIIWTKLLALCRYQGDKEPLIYKASSLGVVNPVWSPKPATEEQILTMPVPDGEGVDRTIALHGEYTRAGYDVGDGDIISGSGFQGGSAGAAGAQSLSGYVHIEAPLTASRSPSAFGTPSTNGASQTQQETTTIYESSATGGGRHGTESPYDDSHMSQHTSNIGAGATMDSRAPYDARGPYATPAGAMKYNRGTMAESPPLPRSQSTGTMTNVGVGATLSGPEGPVRLNNPGDTVHAKIGATLFRPGSQVYAQSVISGTTAADPYDRVDDGAGLYRTGTPHDARLTLPLDTEVMYSHHRPTSYYDDADIMPHHGGMYQGEVHVGHSSVASEQFQETRFM